MPVPVPKYASYITLSGVLLLECKLCEMVWSTFNGFMCHLFREHEDEVEIYASEKIKHYLCGGTCQKEY